MTKPKIHIIGAGFSGLSVGYLLAKSGLFDISIFEKNSKVGGMIQSSFQDGLLVESAANSVLCTNEALAFLNELEIHIIRPLPSAKKRYFFRDGLTRWPLTVLETLKLVPRILFHILTRKKHLQFNSIETVSSWSEKYFGMAFTRYVLSPALQGIYATTANHLNAQNILGAVMKPKKEKYQGIATGRAGMHDVIQALEKKCLSLGVKILTDQTYDFSLDHEKVIVCTSAQDAARTLMLQNKFLAAELEKIKMNHVISITCKIGASASRPQGFGCLIAENTETKCLGVLFNSDIFENRSPNHESSETYIFSNQEADYIDRLPPNELKAYMQKTREVIFKNKAPIQKIYANYWPNGLPIYDHVLADFQKKFTVPENNIYLHGNYVAGIGLSKIIKNSYHIANAIIQEHS